MRLWYNNCAALVLPCRTRSTVLHSFYRAAPLRRDYTDNPRLDEKIPPAAALSHVRTRYNALTGYRKGTESIL